MAGSDNFNRADGGIGADWDPESGTWTVASNTARQTASGGQYRAARFVNPAASSADQDVTVIGRTSNTGGTVGFGCAVRMQNGAITMYAVVGFGGDFFYLLEITAGADAILVTGPACAANTTYTVRLRIVGSTIDWWIDGAAQTGATDSSITATGSAGMVTYGALNGTNDWLDTFSYTEVSSGLVWQADDTGSGADAASGAYAGTVAQPGTGTDAASGALVASQADTGSGADTAAAQLGASVGDTGTGADAIGAALLGASLAETGSGADSASGGLVGSVGDTGTGADATSAQLGASLGDTGSGADATGGAGGAAVGESGSGADTAAAQLGASTSDTGSGVDTVSGALVALVSDTAIGIDGASVPGGSSATAPDTGSGVDTALGSHLATLVEAGVGADTALGAVAALLADTASALETVATVPSLLTPQAAALPYRPARQLGTYRPDEILTMLVLASEPGIYQPGAALGTYRPDEDQPTYRVARGT